MNIRQFNELKNDIVNNAAIIMESKVDDNQRAIDSLYSAMGKYGQTPGRVSEIERLRAENEKIINAVAFMFERKGGWA